MFGYEPLINNLKNNKFSFKYKKFNDFMYNCILVFNLQISDKNTLVEKILIKK